MHSTHAFAICSIIMYARAVDLEMYVLIFINPRCACTARVTVLGLSFRLSVCLSVCYHIFCHYMYAQGGQKAIPTGSVPHWLNLKMAIFVKVLRSKLMAKRTSQYANEHGLPRPDSARFEHGEGSTHNTKASMWSWFAKNTTYRRS